MKRLRLFFIIASLLYSTQSFAIDFSGDDTSSYVTKFLAIEALIVFNAHLAAESPKTYGAVAGVMIPFAAYNDSKSSTATKWVGVITAEAIAFYDIDVDKDKIPKSEIVKKNVIGWNIFALTVGLTEYFTGKKVGSKNLAFAYAPNTDGGQVMMRYKFW